MSKKYTEADYTSIHEYAAKHNLGITKACSDLKIPAGSYSRMKKRFGKTAEVPTAQAEQVHDSRVKYEMAKKLRAEKGLSANAASKEAGISPGLYYYFSSKDGKSSATKSLVPSTTDERPKTVKPREKIVPRLIDLTVAESPAMSDGEVTVAFARVPLSFFKELFGNN